MNLSKYRGIYQINKDKTTFWLSYRRTGLKEMLSHRMEEIFEYGMKLDTRTVFNDGNVT